jgi:lambda family phage portal protein
VAPVVKANLLDLAIQYVAPVAGAKRMAARHALQSARAVYEGAALSPRTAFRRIDQTSANGEIVMGLPRLRNVSRDMGRNNPYASNVHAAIPANVVGAGIIPSIKSTNKKLKAQIQKLIENHLDTPAIDFDGRGTLYALQTLAVRAMVESGDALIVRRYPKASLRLAVPLQVQVLEGDYLDFFKNGPIENGNVCFQGIELDAEGQRVAYWIFEEHPGGGTSWKMPRSRRVDAADVYHLYRADRPGQMRGIPWGASGIMTMWDLKDYEEAELMRQKVAACFAVFFTGAEPGSLAGSVSTTNKSDAGNPVETLEPGLIQRLPAGSTVTTATPPLMNGYRDFITVNARKIACAYGVPYEIATGDMSQVSFISGRLGRMQFNVNVDQWRWQVTIPHMCCGIAKWFLQSAQIPIGRAIGADQVSISWTPPRREMVSPKDEIPAMRDAARSGFYSRSEQVRSLGYDPEAVDQEIADENARADRLKIKFDSDGRVSLNARGGDPAAPPADNAGDGNNQDKGNNSDNGNGDNPPADQGQQ